MVSSGQTHLVDLLSMM